MAPDEATKPDQKLLDEGVPSVNFGGKAWPIPPLSFKQLRLINEKLGRLSKVYYVDNRPMNDYTDEDLSDIGDILYVALTRAHPSLTRAEFDDMPTDRRELIFSFFTVMAQANGIRPDPKKTGEDAVSGEATGPASPSTST